MLMVDDVGSRETLRRIIQRLTSDSALRDDLMQEALIHLWLLEERRPKQTASWYLQNCKYHLRNCLARGRSVDSQKRRRGRVLVSNNGENLAEMHRGPEADGAVLTQVSARDIVSQLSVRLTPVENAILMHLAEGLHAREIAEKLGLSHPTIIRNRRKIAALAIKLGVAPLPRYPKNHFRDRSDAAA
jgi:RNA polymerase sigma factor (sigma-70 family)